MNLKELVVVSGMPGVQRVVSTRNNGMMVADIDTGKVKFASVRKHQFSPLETISIFTDDEDSVELKKVFQNMLDQLSDNPLPDKKASSAALREYFTDILPNHDREQVHISDIKKIIRWFVFLQERDLLAVAEEGENNEEEEE